MRERPQDAEIGEPCGRSHVVMPVRLLEPVIMVSIITLGSRARIACGSRVVKCTSPPGTSSTVSSPPVTSSLPLSACTNTGIAAVCSLSSWPLSKVKSTTFAPSTLITVWETVASSWICTIGSNWSMKLIVLLGVSCCAMPAPLFRRFRYCLLYRLGVRDGLCSREYW